MKSTFFETLLYGAPAFAKVSSSTILPPEIEFAASRGLKLAPSRGMSQFASAARTPCGYPTSDIVQLRGFAAQFPLCRWSMTATDVAVLEYTPSLGHFHLHELCDGDWEGWRETLQFRSGPAQFLIFNYKGQKLRALDRRFVGLRLHSGNGKMLPVPPGSERVWVNSAAIQELPPSLLADGDREEASQPRFKQPFEYARSHAD